MPTDIAFVAGKRISRTEAVEALAQMDQPDPVPGDVILYGSPDYVNRCRMIHPGNLQSCADTFKAIKGLVLFVTEFHLLGYDTVSNVRHRLEPKKP